MRNPSKFQYSDTNPRNNPTFPTNLQFLHPCRIIKLHHAIHSQRLYWAGSLLLKCKSAVQFDMCRAEVEACVQNIWLASAAGDRVGHSFLIVRCTPSNIIDYPCLNFCHLQMLRMNLICLWKTYLINTFYTGVNKKSFACEKPDRNSKSQSSRGSTGLRLSEFVQIPEFFSSVLHDRHCQISESFAKSVNLE